jgi:hypothetical protein
MKEIWKDIPDYNGYQVSNLGRVRTYRKTTYTKRHGIREWRDRILKFKSTNKNAYRTGYRVDLWKDGKPHTMLVARLVAFTFYGEDINNHELTVDHIDGNRFNNNLENLELVSLKENIQRAFKNNLMPTKSIKLINKKTGEEHLFYSMSKTSTFLKRNKGYISSCVKKNKFENEEYKWELVK